MDNTKNEAIFIKGMWAAMFCWGISWVSNKYISAYGTAVNISLLRFIITVISLIVIMIVLKESFKIQLKGIKVVLLAAICLSIYTYFFLQGLKNGLPGAGGVLVTVLNPILTYILTLFLNLRKPNQQELIGLSIGLLAGVFLLQIWSQVDGIFTTGNLYFIAAALLWSILSRFTALAKNFGSSIAFSFWMYLFSTVLMFIVADRNESIRILSSTDWLFWFNLIFSSTVTTAIATTFYFYATVKIGVNKASSYIFLVPISAALGAWVFINEIPKWYTLVGGVLGILAVYVLTKAKK